MRRKESDEQKIVAKWLDAHGIPWFHSPNEARRSYRLAAALKAQGLKAGVPDIIIIRQPPAQPELSGCVIEMKVKPNKLTEAQRIRDQHLVACGWHAAVAYSADEAIAVLVGLGYGRQR